MNPAVMLRPELIDSDRSREIAVRNYVDHKINNVAKAIIARNSYMQVGMISMQ